MKLKMSSNHCFFYFSLVQDVQALRSIVQLVKLKYPNIQLFGVVDKLFINRDKTGLGTKELIYLVENFGFNLLPDMASYQEAVEEMYVENHSVPFFFASESSAAAHKKSHHLCNWLSPIFYTITVQHGYECLGFHHSDEMTQVFGDNINFSSKQVFGWSSVTESKNLTTSSVHKFKHVGFTNLLFERINKGRQKMPAKKKYIIFCETLHGERLQVKTKIDPNEFIKIFKATKYWADRRDIVCLLKPHPVSKLNFGNLPEKSIIFDPIHRLPTDEILCVVSSPSSVAIDFRSLNIPVILWNPLNGFDISNYDYLPTISDFQGLRRYLEAHRLNVQFYNTYPFDPPCLSMSAEATYHEISSFLDTFFLTKGKCNTINMDILICNNIDATQYISFLDRPCFKRDNRKFTVISDEFLTTLEAIKFSNQRLFELMFQGLIILSGANKIIMSRLTSSIMIDVEIPYDVELIFHIDDMLLDIPIELGKSKYYYWNNPIIKNNLEMNISNADRVITSTPKLAVSIDQKLNLKCQSMPNYATPIGPINTSNIDLFHRRPCILYAGTDHTSDTDCCFEAIYNLLQTNVLAQFIVLGPTQISNKLQQLSQFRHFPQKNNYLVYKDLLRSIPAHIGLAPLKPTEFNDSKADTKWVEYTSIGAVTVTNNLTVYEKPIISDGCILTDDTVDSWEQTIQHLLGDFDYWKNVREKAVSFLDNYNHDQKWL